MAQSERSLLSKVHHATRRLLSTIPVCSATHDLGTLRTGTIAQFTLFLKLPIELRRLIWRHTLPGPRRVRVGCRKGDTCSEGLVAREGTAGPPMALQICHEARQEALRYYVLSFGTRVSPPTVYFDYHIDTLCFKDHATPTGYRSAVADLERVYSKVLLAGNVRYLEIHVKRLDISITRFCWAEICRFRGLKEVLVEYEQSHMQKSEIMERIMVTVEVIKAEHPEWEIPKIGVARALDTPLWTIETSTIEHRVWNQILRA
ncbi:hypothetical protein K461DRAFT_135643 [Myriangium duriaei CBS 260.36]|uniref:2EXR domain-containing protein n=1 Tax=Myriangium duriaei CBS 260.36 TaxID=1168546 RepID=A0A9P4MHG1_9PEZI|nr:hypothetical protein K461DRAFT_135643 [Myriangium duriaei CBS 260.36]